MGVLNIDERTELIKFGDVVDFIYANVSAGSIADTSLWEGQRIAYVFEEVCVNRIKEFIKNIPSHNPTALEASTALSMALGLPVNVKIESSDTQQVYYVHGRDKLTGIFTYATTYKGAELCVAIKQIVIRLKD